MTDSNLIRKKISEKKVTLGSWIQLPDVFSAEIMAKSGFDWLAIDLEHGLIDLETTFRLIQTIGLCGVVPIVRLHVNDATTIRRVMDAGAGGVIVPMVNSAQDAQQAVAAVKYPPDGHRSYGLGRAHGFGQNFEQYLKNNNTSSLVVVQIEHREALDNLDAILKVPGIDAIMIGPYDLSGSMGIPGKFDDPKFSSIINQIINKGKQGPVALGIHVVHPSEEDLKERISQGFSFIAYGMDTIFLQDGSQKAVREARKHIP